MQFMTIKATHRRRKRGGQGGGGGGGGGARPPNNLGGGPTYPLAPPVIHPPFPSISMRNGKKSQMYQVEG